MDAYGLFKTWNLSNIYEYLIYVYLHGYIYATMHVLISRINQLLKVGLYGKAGLVKATNHAKLVFFV